MHECSRCGSVFRVELVAVHESDDRGRVEAYLCWGCRQDVTHERLGHSPNEPAELED